MVTVRESPRAKLSPDKNPAQWPPRSPFQALLSSPSGRKKWQDHSAARGRARDVSPSPIKRSSRALQAMTEGGSGDEAEDDDEETQAALELARIEAKLKLEKIRRKKRLAAVGSGAASGGEEGTGSSARASSRAESIHTSPRKTLAPSTSQPHLRRTRDVQVPLSPLKDRVAPTEHVSPARKRLGLSAPAKAVEVSLKRARDGTQIVQPVVEAPRGKSFNERLRATVEQAADREETLERRERVRSKGFGVTGAAMGERQRRDLQRPARTDGENKRPSSARSMPNASRTSKETSVGRSGSVRSLETTDQRRPHGHGMFKNHAQRPASRPTASDSELSVAPSDELKPAASYDSYSELHLSKRHIPHVDIARAVEGKEIYTLPRLLKEVKAPHYDPPDCDTDFVVFAILASKSSPYDQKAKARTNDEGKPQEDAEAPRNKFMVLKLCDLQWEIDCFLFGTAFDQFWKLVPGTLLAILNPDILPPKTNQHSGKFSLKLGSSEDCVMEIGLARDLGYCTSVRKDGQGCEEWVDKRSTEICEFHLNLFIEKQRKGRMEVNTMHRHHHGTGDPDHRPKNRGKEAGYYDKDLNKRRGVTQSREYGTLYSVPAGLLGGKSAASLLDADDTDKLAGWAEGEASRKRIAAGQKERDLQRQLAKLTSGNDSVGAEYMRAQTNLHAPSARSKDLNAEEAKGMFAKPKAAELGLLANTAGGAKLSPAKDRKRHFGLGATGTSGKDAMGWGGHAKWGLLEPKGNRLGSPAREGQTTLAAPTATGAAAAGGGAAAAAARPSCVRGRSEDGSVSPSKKRARFMLAEKGLREPGRESGGVRELGRVEDGDEDDEDGLDIV